MVLLYSARYGDIPHVIPVAARYNSRTEENPFMLSILPDIEANGFTTVEKAGKEFKIT